MFGIVFFVLRLNQVLSSNKNAIFLHHFSQVQIESESEAQSKSCYEQLFKCALFNFSKYNITSKIVLVVVSEDITLHACVY